MPQADTPVPKDRLDYLGDEWSDVESLQDFDVCLDEKKQLFISLVAGLFCSIIIILGFFIYLIKPRLLQISPLLFQGVLIISMVFLVILGLDLVHLSISALMERKLFFSRKNSIFPKHLFVPAIILLGRIFGISKDRISNSFLKFNNALVKTRDPVKEKLFPEQILILLPRCVQHFECTQNVTEDIENCKGCGKCIIKDVAELRKQHGCSVSIVTGGSAARRNIRQLKPSGIIAVACERELLSGIQDIIHLRVLGVINRRPEGPCKNTEVSIEDIRSCLQEFICKESGYAD